ncbi:sigma-54-dependent transcriptional regulator [Paremcibacter congregatus]|uniref:Sigma-54-dependent Fis family transcriptional regulator n=1 Tax=Paremcibacter congregatus TaxID=2043170 RepID=A0A2G4YSL8_9PROT|nr:sigma-54 dependent transcriptional regulator [Paremcibacter congregatus]PHZ85257.1 sigma-54-dependent Fis family transcriptional regulator [Paremcibacter congregatus]QDE27811.1 sigma-54-dependent Fis family transcriptional regulator [Paremcibacter congregatus]
MRLIIVGSLEGQLSAASQIALNNGAKVIHAPDEATALNLIRTKGADLLMIDVKCDIRGLLAQLESEHITTPAVACGVGSTSDDAVAAIRAGAKEYIPLPPDPDLIAAVLTAISDDEHEFIYRDRNMIQVVKLAEQVAASEASIMITGDSGTGKEVMARHVHSKSRRKAKPFIAVNCAAIPENLLESELFGHEKGAFTGAVARRIGKFEEANGGTLLLDEISEMDVRLQAKLLRVVQEREVDRVGGSGAVKVDIRIIATTNRNLQEEVKLGNFREDLLFRLNVVNLNIPSLRNRPEDTRALCKHFARKYAEFNALPLKNVSDSAMKVLINHNWPGNVRELENTIHRAVLLTTGNEIGASDIVLPDGRPHIEIQSGSSHQADNTPEGTEPLAAISLIGRTVADVEKDLIIDTLKHCLGNRTHAANILGISIRTLRNKLNIYMSDGVNVPGPGTTPPQSGY